MKINNRLVGAYGSAVHGKDKLVHEHDFVRATTIATNKYLVSCITCGIHFCELCGRSSH
jgi:hypothetical protein